MLSAVKTFVLPRSAQDGLTRSVFVLVRLVFDALILPARTYENRDRIMAFYAPVSLLSLLVAWILLVLVGYTGMFWATGTGTWYQAFRESGSSLLTMGFEAPPNWIHVLLAFSAASIGLILVALLIAYLPSIYGAFARRETAVKLLEVRAGDPPSAVEMLLRFQRIHGLDRLGEQWQVWEAWFADIDESHTSLSPLVFFRSPLPQHCWVTAAGAVLDAASLTRSSLEVPRDPRADLCIRGGFLALRHISDFFDLPYNPNPLWPDEPISITRGEFEAALDRLAAEGAPVKADRDAAWRDFAGWRVNYDRLLLGLCTLTMAPEAPWSSDRAPKYQSRRLLYRRERRR